MVSNKKSKNQINNILKNIKINHKLLLLILILIGVVVISQFCMKNKDKFSNNNQLVLYYADWCPHCKAIYSYDGSENLLWNKLEKELNNNPINGKEVKCYAVNCADDNNKSLCKNENIEGYPTIKFNGKVYKEKRDYDTIIGYLNSVVS